MKYNSWRVNDPSRLQTSSLKQIRDICYAIALARQAEAFFKKRGDLGKEEHLSIQHILNKGVDYGLVSRDYTLLELGTLVKILQRDGFILDTDCPLTYSLAGTPSASDNSCSTKDPVSLNIHLILFCFLLLMASFILDSCFRSSSNKSYDCWRRGPRRMDG